ncbi:MULTISPECIES: 3-hydroxyacyl-CoA dehydrogenase family protein [Micrococcaceae]|uniref:3-hydroxyacyl-CoA dehydrogenase family protein n=1 Tax=Micrococcaceae TaxID=1268 RepID=UPI00160C2C7F|nr:MULTISPECIES: 3-hydroxyacyl-CoA dehydrogenase family protein [Micrococcaceae]MBB5750649.1 3-hydroxybutyryl-CoA dehydrogenase [Micrococcus sp. TA1]HRO30880.1 3-hydroxyacyl-CoA dehydrogenase family protein [Citricoccus sp.]HRO92960.1 3-hydroxyacyl-CoA dehydrogenase family protein [Citricoccus sp.]
MTETTGASAPEITPSVPATVGVLGGGRMGAGIAHAFLIKGSDVVVVERDEAAAEAAQERVESSTAKSLERGVLDGNLDAILERFTVSVDRKAFADRELVVEAVPEDWNLKVESLRAVERNLAEGAVLASNTSSLSVTGLARELERPQRFLGLHFFNPVPASTLVEVVIGEQTAPELVDAARSWTAGLGKTAVVVNDAPGFASSRLGVAIALEAMRMVEEGVATAEDIDNAMVLGYKHPTGPLRTTDIVGLDVRLGIAEYLASTLGERFEPPAILRDKVARGELGRKSGKGFFDWS